MRNLVLIVALIGVAGCVHRPQSSTGTLAGYAVEPPVVDPAWSRDRECFKNQTAYFEPGESALNDQGMQKIAEVAKYLKENTSTALRIEGHSDDRGTREQNLLLADKRALSARKELIRVGVDRSRLVEISYGRDRPADPRHDAVARKRNRRVEFTLLTPPAP